MDRSSARYRHRHPDDAELRKKLRKAAGKYQRFGCLRLHGIVRRDGPIRLKCSQEALRSPWSAISAFKHPALPYTRKPAIGALRASQRLLWRSRLPAASEWRARADEPCRPGSGGVDLPSGAPDGTAPMGRRMACSRSLSKKAKLNNGLSKLDGARGRCGGLLRVKVGRVFDDPS